MKTISVIVLAFACFVAQTSAICPGFNYGIGNVQNEGGGFNRCAHPSTPLFNFLR
jgi:hypothetical protein